MMQTASPPRTRTHGALILLGIVGLLLIGLAVYLNILDNAAFTASKQSALNVIPSGTPTDPTPNAPVACNNQPMSQDETCQHILTINGSSSTSTYTYTEQQQYQRDARIAQIESQRDQQRATIDERNKPFFSLYGCLSTVICFGGVVLVFLGALAIREAAEARTERRTLSARTNPPTQ